MIVNLYLYSWSGIALGATHVYAELQWSGGNSVELKAALTARQAAELNKKRQQPGTPALQAGRFAQRF